MENVKPIFMNEQFFTVRLDVLMMKSAVVGDFSVGFNIFFSCVSIKVTLQLVIVEKKRVLLFNDKIVKSLKELFDIIIKGV